MAFPLGDRPDAGPDGRSRDPVMRIVEDYEQQLDFGAQTGFGAQTETETETQPWPPETVFRVARSIFFMTFLLRKWLTIGPGSTIRIQGHIYRIFLQP